MSTLERWVATTLANDEASTNEEMKAHFETEGPMPPEQADFYIGQRNTALRSPIDFQLKPYKEGR